jgi:hypothetical protein
MQLLPDFEQLRPLKDHRQLFVSTHNRDFYRLLLNKLRPKDPNDRVKGFFFESWSTHGPTIRREEIDFSEVKIPLQDIPSLIGASAQVMSQSTCESRHRGDNIGLPFSRNRFASST